MSKQFNSSLIALLKYKIREHNKMFIELFGDTLKPKYHLLTHYPTIITQSGPPIFYWCFRFEAKHREIKLYGHVTNSRKNITLTLLKKAQIKFANYFVSPSSELIITKDKHKIESRYSSFLKAFYPNQLYSSYKKIEFNGKKYEKGYFLSRFIEYTLLYEIIELITIEGIKEHVYALCNRMTDVRYNSHYDAFEIHNYSNEININSDCLEILKVNSTPLHLSIGNNCKMVRLKNN